MRSIVLSVALFLGMSLVGCTKKDIVIADFESGTYKGWTTQGEAFGNQPAKGGGAEQMDIGGYNGDYLINSYFAGGDELVGSIESDPFKIERKYINFLLGGGKRTYIQLLVDGEEVRRNQPIVDSEHLTLLTWDVAELEGKTATIKIVDDQKGGWGHILVDQIVMSDLSKTDIIAQHSMTFLVDKDYILVPIQDDAPYTYINLEVDNEVVSPVFELRIAQTNVEYWVPLLVGEYKGKELEIHFDHVKIGDIGHSQIALSDTFSYEYNEKHRPAYHFSPAYGWMNDPNGMVYHDGEYHLYFQHNPYGSTWGNMHWGHTVSKDLRRWEYKPVALAPDHLGSIFSGSAVMDKNNTAGFGENALVALYTSAGELQTQSIAYSLDNGITFTTYENNPVLVDRNIRDFRDPKVFWHDVTNQWIMSLATSQTITFYSSSNLKEWEKLSEFGEGIGSHDGVWECPDLFPLTYNGQTKWVLIVSINPGGPNGGSASQYFIGNFDGKEFKADDLPYPIWLDYGRDNYAGVTWSNEPEGRALFIGWMSNWDYANQVPTVNFHNAMTVPRELKLTTNGEHLVVANYPAKEVDKLRYETFEHENLTVSDTYTIDKLLPVADVAYELEFDIEADKGVDNFSFSLINSQNESLLFTFDIEGKELIVDRSQSGLVDFSRSFAHNTSVSPLVKGEKFKVRLLLDTASSELFINGGVLVQTNIIFPAEPYNSMKVESKGGSVKLSNFKTYTLK